MMPTLTEAEGHNIVNLIEKLQAENARLRVYREAWVKIDEILSTYTNVSRGLVYYRAVLEAQRIIEKGTRT
jgi:hypothetical protein